MDHERRRDRKAGAITTTTAPPSRRGLWYFAVRALSWSGAAILVSSGVVVTLVAAYLAAPAIDSVLMLVGVAVLIGGFTVAGGGLLLAPGLGLARRRAAAVLSVVVVVASLGLFAAAGTAGRTPVPGPIADPRGPHETWVLSTGSRIAVWKRPADVPRHRTPVVFLHGGPGMYTQASKIAEGAALRAAGFDTVYFDQAGGGASSRLPVTQYTFNRAIQDVEAFRRQLGADRIVLWGNSFGAQLAAAYTATYPDRVAGLLLTSPGAFPGQPSERNYTGTNRSDDTEFSGRMFLATVLMDVNPLLAEDFVGQPEAGAMLDEATRQQLSGAFVCKGADDRLIRDGLTAERGGNLFANRLIAADIPVHHLPRSTVDVPALVVRGACDFIPRSQAERYAAFAAVARVVDVPDDGHGLRANRQAVDSAVATFASTDLAPVP